MAERRAAGPTAVNTGVSIGASIFALGLGLLAWSQHTFRLGDDHGIVSWVTVHRYPIQQETVALVGGVVCVVLGVLVGQGAFSWLTRRLSGRGGLDDRSARRLAAFGLGLLGSSGLAILAGVWTVWGLVVAPVAASSLGIGLGYRARKTAFVRGLPATPIDPAPAREAPTKDGHRSIVRRALVGVVVPALLYVGLYDTTGIFMAPVDTLHEGERLAHITELRHGRLPYRDFYVQHGLGQDVLKAWLADTLLDGTVAAQRLVERALRPLGGVALYWFGLAISRSWITALLLTLALTSGRLDVHDRLVLGLLAIAALARGLLASAGSGHVPARAPTSFWTVAAGALAGLAFWYSTEIGLYAAAACGTTLLAVALLGAGRPRERSLPIVWLGGGWLLAVLPIVLVGLAAGALDEFARNTWIQITHQRLVWGLPFPSYADAVEGLRGPSDVVELLQSRVVRFYVPIVILLAAAGALTHRARAGVLLRGQRGLVVLLVSLYAGLLLYTALGRSDQRHLMYAAAPAYALLFLWLESGWLRARAGLRRGGARGRALRAGIPVAGVTVLLAVWWIDAHDAIGSHFDRSGRILSGRAWPRADRPRVWAPLGAMGGSQSQIPYLRRVSEYIEATTDPGEPFYDFTNQAVFFFLADRPSASRYVFVAYAATPDLEREVIAELEAARTSLVLYRAGHGSDELDGVPLARRHPLIDRYLRDHYAPAKRIGGTVFLLRRPGV